MGDADPGRPLVVAVAYFLAEGSSEEPGYAYPGFRREDGVEQLQELELVVPVDLWRRFEAEAERQRVPADRLLEHAAFFLVSQDDAGRIAERIAKDLGIAP